MCINTEDVVLKVNEISNSLKEIDSAVFQKLCDAYITKLKIGTINAIGSQSGINKTTPGTPDTFISKTNGKYIFIEYTTQKSGLKQKILDDIRKCLYENDLEISINKIEKIIYFHNRKLKGKDTQEIMNFCQEKGVLLDIYGIDHLSLNLAHHYPDLAEAYLNIPWESGELMNLEQFINQSSLLPLNNEFFFREAEIESVFSKLQEKDILIIRGSQGVGKTRLAIESLNRYQNKNPEFEIFCIDNKSNSLRKSIYKIQAYYENLLILIDDANRIDNLDLILSTIEQSTKIKEAKIILTLRDYALSAIKEVLNLRFDYQELQISSFKRHDLYEILKSDSIGSLNEIAIEAILNVSNGNVRMALMAANLLLKTNDLRSINEIPKIYDQFFQELLKKIQSHDSILLKQSLAIVAFFHKIDGDNPNFINILNIVGIDESDFWECISILNQYEIVDLYPTRRLCAISDQLEATYFFYKFVIERKHLNFRIFLTNFTFFGPDKMRDALVPSTQIFGISEVREKLYDDVSTFWNESSLSFSDKLVFSSVFSFLISDQVLIFLDNYIESLDSVITVLEFSGNIHGVNEEVYRLLNSFAGLEVPLQKSALILGCKYFVKRHDLAHEFIEFIKHSFRYDRIESQYNTDKQSLLFETLIAQATNYPIIDKVIIHIAPFFLSLYHDNSYSEGRTFTISRFFLQFNEKQKELHTLIWNYIIKTCNKSSFFQLLDEYINLISYPVEKMDQIITNCLKHDLEYSIKAISLFESDLSISDLKIINNYLSLLAQFKVEHHLIKSLERYLDKPIYKQFELISGDIYRKRRRLEDLDYQEATNRQVEDIHDYLNNLTRSELTILFDNIRIIRIAFRNNQFDTNFGLSEIYRFLLNKDFSLFLEIIKTTLEEKNAILLDPRSFTIDIFKFNPKQISKYYELIKSHDFDQKQIWFIAFFSSIPFNKITPFYYNQLIQFLTDEFENAPYYLQFDFLLKFEEYKSGSFIQICRILYDNRDVNNCDFSLLLNKYTDVNQKISTLFKDDMNLLKEIWLYMSLKDTNIDHDSVVLALIMENDESFIVSFLESQYKRNPYFFMHTDNRSYSFIWEMDNSFIIIDQIIEFVLSKSNFFLDMNIIKQFFKVKETEQDLRDIQLNYLKSRIEIHSKDISYIDLLFIIVKSYFFDSFPELIELFLDYNKNYDDFKDLSIDFNQYSGNGTFIDPYTKLLNLWENILSILDDPIYFKHRLFVKEKIMYWKHQVEGENKKLFHFDYEF